MREEGTHPEFGPRESYLLDCMSPNTVPTRDSGVHRREGVTDPVSCPQRRLRQRGTGSRYPTNSVHLGIVTEPVVPFGTPES